MLGVGGVCVCVSGCLHKRGGLCVCPFIGAFVYSWGGGGKGKIKGKGERKWK